MGRGVDAESEVVLEPGLGVCELPLEHWWLLKGFNHTVRFRIKTSPLALERERLESGEQLALLTRSEGGNATRAEGRGEF